MQNGEEFLVRCAASRPGELLYIPLTHSPPRGVTTASFAMLLGDLILARTPRPLIGFRRPAG